MNRGQRHANLYAEYVADVEERVREARERAIEYEEDCWFDEYDDWDCGSGEWRELVMSSQESRGTED